jgi:hypothetical protein
MNRFNPRVLSVGFVVDKVALLMTFLSLLRFILSVTFQQYSIPVFILILPLSEGQAGEACEPSNKGMLGGKKS